MYAQISPDRRSLARVQVRNELNRVTDANRLALTYADLLARHATRYGTVDAHWLLCYALTERWINYTNHLAAL